MIMTESLKYEIGPKWLCWCWCRIYIVDLVGDLAVDLISDNDDADDDDDDDDDEIFVCEEADKPEQLGSNPFWPGLHAFTLLVARNVQSNFDKFHVTS